jgi:hypothetical protein
MADETSESPERSENGRSGSDSAKSAIKAAALAAATTAGAAAARKAFTRGGSGSSDSGSPLTDALESAWDAARDHLLPHAEEAMEAIGRYLAEDAPEILRDRLVPRLVQAFEDARSDAGGTSRSGD